jgi:prepilin-type N-terminal cleavage/methylation domain-containing protein
MKIPGRLQLLTVVDRCLRWFSKPSSTPRSGLNHRQPPSTARRTCGYTLIEVLAAGAIVSVGATAMVSLSSTLMLQEELATRVAITRNHQENMVRLWQLGLSPVQITSLMPSQAQNALLQQAVHGTPALVETGLTTINGVVMETASCTAAVNISQDPRTEIEGASFTLTAYRPRLVTDLRPPPP